MRIVKVIAAGMLIASQWVVGGVLFAPDVIKAGADAYPTVDKRQFQGISSLAVSPGGQIWVTWYAGPTPGEDKNNYVVLATSGDDGRTWREVMVVDPDGPGPLRAYDPEIWVNPDGRLWLFWAQAVSYGKRAQTWAMIAEDGDAGDTAWGEPFHIAPGVMMCKPTVLENGDWLFPISDWEARVSDSPNAASAAVYISRAPWRGQCFRLLGQAMVPVDVRQFDEHMVVERDGSLWMLVRTRYGIGESISTDGGRTWGVVEPSDIQHATTRFFISRLESGNLLLVKHGPIDQRTSRTDLMAFISKDDGRKWKGGLLLDGRSRISYPDGQQASDGRIYITYDFWRTGQQEILMAVFTEADVLAGEDVSGKVRLQVLVNKPEGTVAHDPSSVSSVDQNEDGQPQQNQPAGALVVQGASSRPLEAGQRLFTDRGYTAHEMPSALSGARFLQVPLDGDKTARCTRSGMIYFMTPKLNRNQDSQSEALKQQGFAKVALPETRLFDPDNLANFCTVYQKECVEGEIITFGKWAVPIFYPQED